MNVYRKLIHKLDYKFSQFSLRGKISFVLISSVVLMHYASNEEQRMLEFASAQEAQAIEVGAALFDLKNPYKLLAKSPLPIISPHKKYEKEGFVENVVFQLPKNLTLAKKSAS